MAWAVLQGRELAASKATTTQLKERARALEQEREGLREQVAVASQAQDRLRALEKEKDQLLDHLAKMAEEQRRLST